MDESPDRCWLGVVVPKRHARRAVTRNLVKRQMRAQMAAAIAATRLPDRFPTGLWVLRLKVPFDKVLFRSASSAALHAAVRDELRQLLARAAVQGLAFSAS